VKGMGVEGVDLTNDFASPNKISKLFACDSFGSTGGFSDE